MLFFPIFTVEVIKLCNTIVSVYEPLWVLTFLMAHRAQITAATTGLLQKDKVLQLESIKWNSKMLANNPALKLLFAQIAMVTTLQFEIQDIDKSEEESAEILKEKCEVLSKEIKPKSARVLSNSALNEKNISLHRHGKIAQCIGLVQARPIFEPSNVFKGISMSNITLQQLANLFVETAEKLGLQPEENSVWSNAYASAPDPKTAAETAAVAVLTHYLPIEKESDKPMIIFDDALFFGSDNNLLPLEGVLHMERPQKSKEDQNIGPLTDDQRKNPFLVAAVNQRDESLKEISKRTKPGAKPKSAKSTSTDKNEKIEKGRRTRAGRGKNSKTK